MTSTDLLVVGGGIVGLSIAWGAAKKGATVTIADPTFGQGASWAAAGILAPVTGPRSVRAPLIDLNLRSAAAWPGFAAELEVAGDITVAYEGAGTLAVAFDDGDRSALKELFTFHQELGLESSWLQPSECRDLEGALTPSVCGGLLVAGDHQVDPRRVTAALVTACECAGVRVLRDEVAEVNLDTAGKCVTGGRLASGDVVSAGQTVLAAGWQAAATPGLPRAALPPVRPVKGQIIRLRWPPQWSPLRHTVRAVVKGTSLYVVPRPDGEVVVGATVEEAGPDSRVTLGGIYSLARDSQLVLPLLMEAELVEAVARLRPASPDNAPIIGPGSLQNLLVATGHFRNGILLAPVTAELITGLLGEPAGELPDWAAGFDPRRFGSTAGADLGRGGRGR